MTVTTIIIDYMDLSKHLKSSWHILWRNEYPHFYEYLWFLFLLTLFHQVARCQSSIRCFQPRLNSEGSKMCALDAPSTEAVVSSVLECSLDCMGLTGCHHFNIKTRGTTIKCDLYRHAPTQFGVIDFCIHYQDTAYNLVRTYIWSSFKQIIISVF